MKSLLLAGAMMIATGTCVFAQGGYWVVGNRATSKCEAFVRDHAQSRR